MIVVVEHRAIDFRDSEIVFKERERERGAEKK